MSVDALNIRPQNYGEKYFGGRTNEIRDQFSLSVKNAARADGKRHHQTATLLELLLIEEDLAGTDNPFDIRHLQQRFHSFDMAESSLQVCTRFPRHFLQTKKFRGSDLRLCRKTGSPA